MQLRVPAGTLRVHMNPSSLVGWKYSIPVTSTMREVKGTSSPEAVQFHSYAIPSMLGIFIYFFLGRHRKPCQCMDGMGNAMYHKDRPEKGGFMTAKGVHLPQWLIWSRDDPKVHKGLASHMPVVKCSTVNTCSRKLRRRGPSDFYWDSFPQVGTWSACGFQVVSSLLQEILGSIMIYIHVTVKLYTSRHSWP